MDRTSVCGTEGHRFDSCPVYQFNTIINCVKTKEFYSIKLKCFKENVPVELAITMLKEESPLVNYLSKNGALVCRFWNSNNTLHLRGETKHLMIGKMMYPELFPNKGRVGFMELYISRIINKKLNLVKGSG